MSKYPADFKSWLLNKFPPPSNTPSSYLKALELLSKHLSSSDKFDFKSVYEIDNINDLIHLYKYTLEVQRNEESSLYNSGSRGYGSGGYYSAAVKSYIDFFKGSNPPYMDASFFQSILYSSGLIYSQTLTTRFISSLLTKPFVILTGLSGSGKTKLAQAFVEWVSGGEDQYCIVPVGADWTNREPLLGYPNALKQNEYVKPDNGVLDLILRAQQDHDHPYFLILDEMNLSHVERYFADFLSAMESKEAIPLHSGKDKNWGDVPSSITLPDNLFIIGTVNIDETTNMFSPKVLDRANTIEFRVNKKEIADYLENMQPLDMDQLKGQGAGMVASFLQMSRRKAFDQPLPVGLKPRLIQFFEELSKTGAEFGYRSASEIVRLVHQLTELDTDNELSDNDKIDIAVMQKLLPKLHGSRRKLVPVLRTLGGLCVKDSVTDIEKDLFQNDDLSLSGNADVLLPLSLEKVRRMYLGARDNGYASYAEA